MDESSLATGEKGLDPQTMYFPSENLVCSLEKAKDLYRAGYPQNACMFWVEYTDKVTSRKYEPFLMSASNGNICPILTPPKTHILYAAPLSCEILGRLPYQIEKDGIKHCLNIWKNKNGSMSINYTMLWTERPKESYLPNPAGFSDQLLANAASDMWILLKKNKLLSALPS